MTRTVTAILPAGKSYRVAYLDCGHSQTLTYAERVEVGSLVTCRVGTCQVSHRDPVGFQRYFPARKGA